VNYIYFVIKTSRQFFQSSQPLSRILHLGNTGISVFPGCQQLKIEKNDERQEKIIMARKDRKEL